jgi:hypothetical protein
MLLVLLTTPVAVTVYVIALPSVISVRPVSVLLPKGATVIVAVPLFLIVTDFPTCKSTALGKVIVVSDAAVDVTTLPHAVTLPVVFNI